MTWAANRKDVPEVYDSGPLVSVITLTYDLAVANLNLYNSL
jgi:hypothetical protein